MEGLLFIVIVLISIISMAASSAKKKSGNQGEPQRRTLSDIQRAFMMMSGLDDDEQQTPRNVPPAAPQQPRYTPPAATVQSRMSSSMSAAYGEGISDFGTLRSGSIIGETIIEKEAGRAGDDLMVNASVSSEGYGSEYTAEPSGSIRGNTVIEDEVGAGKYTRAAESIKDGEEPIYEDELPLLQEDLSREIETARPAARPALKLFAGKNEFLRAVIYSEILGSGPLGKGPAR